MPECEGHPASEFGPMGETEYCDGSCIVVDLSEPDIRVENHGTIAVLQGLTIYGIEWLEDNLNPYVLKWGWHGYVAEPRCVQPIIDGAEADGLAVAV